MEIYRCSKCGQKKPKSDFYKSFIEAKSYWCKECSKKNRKDYYNKHIKGNKLRIKEQNLSKYGLTYESFQELYLRQEMSCAICKTEKELRNLFVDHCHETGKVRGLLCLNCNTLLGHAKDKQSILSNAIIYLNTSLDD